MTESDTTRPATWQDVKQVASILARHGVKYALIGGYALAAHGIVRFSEDIDILVSPDEDNTRRWILALSELPDGAAQELAGEEATLWEGEGPLAIRINDEFTIDVMAAACGHVWAELSSDVEIKVVDGQPIQVLGVESLLLTKQGMRDRDRADAQVLRELIAAKQRS
ncbi:MAG TPA: nucleotidyl transferase AbiEii/AbiGii toxin family protein [Polyangiaceae bacterium]|nr:nucleotidyl transferase AbiEii/AbiGii toxin family protein [Polyangiaceae bacterium]